MQRKVTPITENQAESLKECGYKFRTACMTNTWLGRQDEYRDIFSCDNRIYVLTDEMGSEIKLHHVRHIINNH